MRPRDEQFFVGSPDFDEALNGGAGLRRCSTERREIGFVDQHARLGMVQNGGEFERREPNIERHDDGAGQRNAEVAFQKLVVVEAEVGDAVARLDARGEQAGRQPLAAFAEFGIGEAAGAADDAGLFAVEIDGAIEAADRRQRHVHALRLYNGGRRSGMQEAGVRSREPGASKAKACAMPASDFCLLTPVSLFVIPFRFRSACRRSCGIRRTSRSGRTRPPGWW